MAYHKWKIGTLVIGIGQSPAHPAMMETRCPTMEVRDRIYDQIDPEAWAFEHGLPNAVGLAPVGTFLDFGDMAFDARDVLAVEKRTTARITGGGAEVPASHLLDIWVSRTGGSEALRLILNYGEANTVARHRDYRRIVAAMKASR